MASKININEQKFIPDRISGDIPFHQFRSLFMEPPKYIQFLKMLEGSTSRHDFLFWLFDIITGGREKDKHLIRARELDQEVKRMYPRFVINLQYATDHVTISQYLMHEYPKIFKISYDNTYMDPLLSTFPNDKAIFDYRSDSLKKIEYSKFVQNISDEFLEIDLMRGLSPDDFPETPEEISFEDINETIATQPSYFTIYNHFVGLLTFTTRIPESDDCILAYKCPYKLLHVEAFMKNIDIDDFVKSDALKIEKLFKEDAIVIVVVNTFGEDSSAEESDDDHDFLSTSGTSNYIYKRAKLLCNIPSPSTKKVWVHFVDYGEICTVFIRNIYPYKFEENVPKLLTIVVPENKLPKTPEKDDFFVFDLNKMKYVFVGKPTKNFNPAPDLLEEFDTDTESVEFGPGTSKNWENEFEEESGGEIILEDNDDRVFIIENTVTPPGNKIVNLGSNDCDNEFGLSDEEPEFNESSSSSDDENSVDDGD